jgi:hypothetical protein
LSLPSWCSLVILRIVPLRDRHHERLGVRLAGAVADAVHELAVGDAGRDEEAVVGRHEVVGRQDAIQIVPGVDRALALVVIDGPQLALDDAADGLDRARRDDALGRAADADEQVDPGVGTRCGDAAGDVAVDDELDAGTRGADLVDQIGVPGTVEHADRDVAVRDALRLGDQRDVLGDRQADVDDIGGLGPGDELLHVEDGRRVVHRAARGDGHDGHGVRQALGGQGRPVDRVDRDVARGAGAVTDLLAVEQHGCFVLLTLADHDDALHLDGVDERAHRVDRDPVGTVLVTAADPAAGSHGSGLGHADQVEGEISVGRLSGGLEAVHGDILAGGGRVGVGSEVDRTPCGLPRKVSTRPRQTPVAATRGCR